MIQAIPSLFQITQVELIYRNKVKPEDRLKARDSRDAFNIFIEAWDLNRIDLLEEFKIMLLDRSSACIGVSDISIGGVSETTADSKIIWATALTGRASQIILAHNHPSGNLIPSRADIEVTEKFCKAARLLDIRVKDHLIITPLKYYSMADEGYIP